MKDLFHGLLEHLNSCDFDYKERSINTFLLKSGYKKDSLEDALIIKNIILVLEKRLFIDCHTVLFAELFACTPLSYNYETGKHDVPTPHVLSNVDVIVSLTSVGKLYIEGREREIRQGKFNKTQKNLTLAIMFATVAYVVIAGIGTCIQYKYSKQGQQSNTQQETKTQDQMLQDSSFLKRLKNALKYLP